MSKSPVVKHRTAAEVERPAESGALEPDAGSVAQPPAPVPPVAEAASAPDAASAPSAMVPPAPANMAAPVPRIRGSGPICPIPGCGSGMVVNGRDRSNHPFIVRVYYRCLKKDCKGTFRREERK